MPSLFQKNSLFSISLSSLLFSPVIAAEQGLTEAQQALDMMDSP
ncbi:hypothetical protein [Psychrobacter sp. I-STPA6b]|nr:hypothetical protein [Psychrobacter sp. I-STPA6b]